jgi:hypothetical protein
VAVGTGVLVLLSSGIPLAACGTTSSAAPTGRPTVGRTDAVAVVDDADPSAPATEATRLPARAGRVLSAAQVRAVLLTTRDLGDGWTQWDVEPRPATRTTPARCARTLAAMHGKPPGPQAGRSLSAGRIGPYVSESVTSLPTAALGRLTMLTEGLTSCSRYQQTVRGVGAFAVTVTPARAPALGDRAAAFRITQTTTSTRYVVDYLAVAVGHNLLVLQAGGWSPMTPDDLRDLVAKSLAKLSTV